MTSVANKLIGRASNPTSLYSNTITKNTPNKFAPTITYTSNKGLSKLTEKPLKESDKKKSPY